MSEDGEPSLFISTVAAKTAEVTVSGPTALSVQLNIYSEHHSFGCRITAPSILKSTSVRLRASATLCSPTRVPWG